MKRDIEKELYYWKVQRDRFPLIVRGARQVGKSWTIESFGKSAFKNVVVVNFEFQPELKQCFNTLDPVEIINKLQLIMGVKIEEEETLLFLDEIQECPNAIVSLRYFKEKMERLAIISAGSLVEFALKSPDFRMPVGRIQFLYMEPLSFGEFLSVTDNGQLRNYLSGVTLNSVFDDLIHNKLLELFRLYLILGGMPAVLKNYTESKDLLSCQRIQNSLLQTYRNDFGKYAKHLEYKYIQKVFDMAPRLVGERIKYSNIDSDSKSQDLKRALNLLVLAGVIKPVYATSASGIPLGAEIKESKFKINFLDVGLMQNACGLQSELAMVKDLMQVNSGAVAEQVMGQELRAYQDRYADRQLFFWARDKKSSSAEVDYVINIGSTILPVEVKAGKTGRLKSLRLFMQEKKLPLGIRFSQDKLSYFDGILTVPLFMAEQLARLVENIIMMQ